MRTQEAFTIQLLDCAHKIGLVFHKVHINNEGKEEHIFKHPRREDKSPSIYINPLKNVFYDYGRSTYGKGGIIAFINHIYGNVIEDTSGALKILDSIYPELKHYKKKNIVTDSLFSLSNITPVSSSAPAEGYNKKKEVKNTFRILEVKDLYYYPLKNYLEQERYINIDIAAQHVKEIVYKHIPTNKTYYAIGIKAGDTWAVRSKYFKGFLGDSVGMSIIKQDSDIILIFEGLMDFLSFLTIENTAQPKHSVLILNSSSFTREAIDYLQVHEDITTVQYFKQNDEEGNNSFQLLKKSVNQTVIDKSGIYLKFKDFNDYLVSM